MIKRKLLKPRKVMWVMRDFINDIHGLTVTHQYLKKSANDFDGDVNAWLDWFGNEDNWENVEVPCQVKLTRIKNHGFSVCVDDKGEDEFRMSYSIEELWSFGSKQFAQDFFARCPMGRGFASVTLAILHELGHMNAEQEFEGYDRKTALIELRKSVPRSVLNFEYFKLPDEKSATDWAIEWLNDPENRKKAKQFEKEFFACFEKKA